jgi:hypothetical protein
MTGSDQRSIVDTLHQMELRMSERLVRVETELREWRKDYELLQASDIRLTETVNELRSDFEVERQACDHRATRTLIGLAIVSVLAIGQLVTKALILL